MLLVSQNTKEIEEENVMRGGVQGVRIVDPKAKANKK